MPDIVCNTKNGYDHLISYFYSFIWSLNRSIQVLTATLCCLFIYQMGCPVTTQLFDAAVFNLTFVVLNAASLWCWYSLQLVTDVFKTLPFTWCLVFSHWHCDNALVVLPSELPTLTPSYAKVLCRMLLLDTWIWLLQKLASNLYHTSAQRMSWQVLLIIQVEQCQCSKHCICVWLW